MSDKTIYWNLTNDDPRFQSYMSAEEDDRKMLNTYIEKAAKAKEEGIKQGREEGLEQGREEGTKKNQAEVCKRMMDKGYPLKSISDCLGMSIEEVEVMIKQ